MAERAQSRGPRVPGPLFATCAGCTLWLVLQNAMLLALLSWNHFPVARTGIGAVARTLTTGLIEVALVSAAFGLGWLVARHAADPRAELESGHE